MRYDPTPRPTTTAIPVPDDDPSVFLDLLLGSAAANDETCLILPPLALRRMDETGAASVERDRCAIWRRGERPVVATDGMLYCSTKRPSGRVCTSCARLRISSQTLCRNVSPLTLLSSTSRVTKGRRTIDGATAFILRTRSLICRTFSSWNFRSLASQAGSDDGMV